MQTTELEASTSLATSFGRQYAASDIACSRARRDVAAVLSDLGLSEDGVFAGQVVTSELFANAVQHHPSQATEQVRVEVWTTSGSAQRWVGIAVTDAGRGCVRAAKDAEPEDAECGRGLELARGLGARLTDVRTPKGYTVTAWVPVTDRLRQRVCLCDCATAHGREPSVCSWLIEEGGPWGELGDEQTFASRLCPACFGLAHTATDAVVAIPMVVGR